jgi:hypothetical protein
MSRSSMLALFGEETVADWFREWATVEEEATVLRWSEPLFVPGLLQTERYAREVFSVSGLHVGDEIEQHVASRMDRRGPVLTFGPRAWRTFVADLASR